MMAFGGAMRRTVALSLVLCSALASLASDARPRRARARVVRPRARVAVVPLSGSGKAAAKLAASTTRALVKSLRRSRSLQARVIEQRRAAKLRLCLQEQECVRTLASSLGTSLLITGHVEPQGTGFHVDLRVVAGASGEVVQSEGLDLGVTGGVSAARLALRLLDRGRRGVSKVVARRTPVVAPERFSTSEAESAAAVVEARDTEDPLTRRAAASRPVPPPKVVVAAPTPPV
jgi:TolB-like protein